MQLAMRVLEALASERERESQEPRFVSGATLAEQFAVTRSAVWKSVGLLREWGTPIEAVTNQGYRLALPASPLRAEGVRAALAPHVAAMLRQGECEGSIASTNAAMLCRCARFTVFRALVRTRESCAIYSTLSKPMRRMLVSSTFCLV